MAAAAVVNDPAFIFGLNLPDEIVKIMNAIIQKIIVVLADPDMYLSAQFR